MVMLRSVEPVSYELFDELGRSLGQVVLPREAQLIGPAAGTVLLQRPMPRVQPRWTESAPRAA